MRKALLLVVLFTIIFPVQVFAAKSMSTGEIERIYFEDYKDNVKEVKKAQKNLKVVLGTDVAKLAEKLKQVTVKYNQAVKNKSSKNSIESLKKEKDKIKKDLTTAKKQLTTMIKSYTSESNFILKSIAEQKTQLVKFIKDHYAGKDKLSEAQFNKEVLNSINDINRGFELAIEYLNEAYIY